MDGHFSILALWSLCSESVGEWNFEILVKDSNIGGQNPYLRFSFQVRYVNFVWKMRRRRRQKGLLNEGNEGEVAYMEKNEKKFITHLKFHH